GYPLCVYTRTKSRAVALLAEGASWMDSPAALACEVDCVISIVGDSPDVLEVFCGERGVCTTLRAGTLCIDMSTVAPEVTVSVAAKVAECGGAFLDAPVSGGRTGAEDGKLSIMVGGDERDVARARPIFDVLGKSTVHVGPVGHGQLAKVCNQILCGLNLLGVSEAMVLAGRTALDPRKMLQAVRAGAAGSWAVDNLGPRILTRDFDPMFMIDLQQKDLRIALETARQQAVPLPGTALVSQLLTANQAAGEGREGTQALVKTLERLGATGGGSR
ncbi:MAG: NAD(P)-dependent oxidoreductase, partial [Phycisphaerae bacterium]